MPFSWAVNGHFFINSFQSVASKIQVKRVTIIDAFNAFSRKNLECTIPTNLKRHKTQRMYNSDAFNLYLTCDRMKGVNKEVSTYSPYDTTNVPVKNM